jgi:hypothetical protein
MKIYRRDRTGSALVSMDVGIRAELRSAEMSMLVPGCWSSGTLPRGRWEVVRLKWGHPPAAPVSDEKPFNAPIRCPVGGLKLRSFRHVRRRPPVGDQGHWFGR